MRAFFATTSLGALSAATLLLPLAPALPAAAVTGPPGGPAESAVRDAPGPRLPGSTQSLRLTAAARDGSDRAGRPGPPGEQGLAPRTVRPFSLLGMVWADPAAELDGTVRVRTRDARTGAWSPWRQLTPHADDAPGPRGTEATGRTVLRGATVPLWVGASDGVQVRVRPYAGGELPRGLRLELVDPGDAADGPAARPGGPPEQPGGPRVPDGRRAPSRDAAGPAQPRMLPALSKADTEAAAAAEGLGGDDAADDDRHIGPRPGIVTRRGWGADERMREGGFRYTRTVKAAFVHHTAMTNSYSCSQAPSIIRSIYRYHVRSSGWRDIGYNFLIDKCGTIYEGRAGGVTEPVQGAHTYGFNSNSMGVAVLGSFDKTEPPTAAVEAIAKLTGWKLGLYGVNPRGSARMTSGGKSHKLRTVSGHRDGFNTACPGDRLYGKLGSIRALAARLQGR